MNTRYNKTTYSILGGAIVAVAMMLLKKFAGVEFSTEETQSITVVVMAALTYFVPNKEA